MMKGEREQPENLLLLPRLIPRSQCQDVRRCIAGVDRRPDVLQVIALLRRALPRFEVWVNVREHEIYTIIWELYAIRYALSAATPGGIFPDAGVDDALDEGSGAPAAGAEVDEGVGFEAWTEEGPEFGCEKGGAGGGLDEGDFEKPEDG